VQVNTELVYQTKAAAEKEEPPLGILFRTRKAKETLFVELELTGLCAIKSPIKVIATGAGEGAIPGLGGVDCKAENPETLAVVKEINCPEPATKEVFNYFGGVLTKYTVGLETNKEKAEQVGTAKIELETKEAWGSTGK